MSTSKQSQDKYKRMRGEKVKNNKKDDRKVKGEKRDRQTAKQSCQPLGKLKIKKREEEKKKGGEYFKFYNKLK